jgi:hypothetical protein
VRTFIAALFAALASASCSDVDPYTCSGQEQCQIEEAGIDYYGFCEYETGRCAWWESSCPGGLVFDESAGDAAGTCVPGTCESDVIVSPPTEVACSASTRECVETCEDECDEDDECADECWGECLDGDADPGGCDDCVADAYVACANASGCQPQWDGVECCFDGCDDPGSPECESACAEAGEEHDSCAAEFDAACGQTVIDSCFPPA